MNAVRNEIDIRYSMVVEDALRAVNKSYFDPKMLMKVCIIMFLNNAKGLPKSSF